MKALDRLIIRAKKKCGVDRLEVGFISPSEKHQGKWVARGDIWNGVPGNGVKSIMYGEYDSVEEAEKALNELAEQYPNNKNVFIFIENILE